MSTLERVVRQPRPSRATVLPPFEITGPPGAPVIVVLGGISATRHVCATASDSSPGWWSRVVGAGCAIDTRRYRVLSFDYLPGGRGLDGRPARTVTTGDQAMELAALLDALGIPRALAVVGASYGGMVALAFAAHHSERVDRLIVISAPHESHPMSTALRTLQRRIVELGLETGRGDTAMNIARGLAMTTYRSAREFAARFAPLPEVDADGRISFEVERYLVNRGRHFAASCPPERFLALSLSSDLHRVDPAHIHTPTLVIAAEGDTLVPAEQLQALARRLAGPTRLANLPSSCGHDAFLTEPRNVGRLLTVALSGRILT